MKGIIETDSNLDAVRHIKESRTPDWSSEFQGLEMSVWENGNNIAFAVQRDSMIISSGQFEEWSCHDMNEWFGKVNVPCPSELMTRAIVRVRGVKASIQAWENQNLFEYGSVVIFERLRIEGATRSESAIIWTAINQFIRKRFGKAGLILIKPCPLGRVKEYTRNALVRLYGSRLGAERLSDEWLWIRMGDNVPDPNCRSDIATSCRQSLSPDPHQRES